MKIVLSGFKFILKDVHEDDIEGRKDPVILMELAMNRTEIGIYKRGEKCGFNAFGISMTMFNSAELIYMFAMLTKKSLSIYTEHPLVK